MGFSPASFLPQEPLSPALQTHWGDFHNLCETLMPAITARVWGSLLADSTTIGPVTTSLVSSDYFLGRKSLFSF